MSLDNEQVKRIAHLARLSLDDNEASAYANDLSNILALVEQMEQCDTSNITPMAHPLDLDQRLRPDQVTEENQRDNLQACAPATEDGLFLVPRVIE